MQRIGNRAPALLGQFASQKGRPRVSSLLVAVGVISLWFTITNLIAGSLAFIPALVLVPVLFFACPRQPKVVVGVWLTLLYFLASTLVYYPASFLEYGFYRYDGNVFTTLAPILLFGMCSLNFDADRMVRAFLTWVTIVDSAFILVFLLKADPLFLEGKEAYHLLFIAHNAAGGYLATVCALSLGYWYARRGAREYLWVAINGLGLALTYSRGSWFGLVAAVLITLVLRERYLKLICVLYVASLAALLSYTYPVWIGMQKMSSIAVLGDVQPDVPLDIDRRDTIVARAFFLWPRAFDLWLESPIVGTGFGSYNDIPYHLQGVEHVVMFNSTHVADFSDAHAHHMYLHLMAETGLVGLGLVTWMLYWIRRFLGTMPAGGLKCGLILAFWTVVWASVTENRLFAPSQMLPFTIILGLAIGARHALRSHGRPRARLE